MSCLNSWNKTEKEHVKICAFPISFILSCKDNMTECAKFPTNMERFVDVHSALPISEFVIFSLSKHIPVVHELDIELFMSGRKLSF